jgi:ATP-binding cassette subfamily F protein uup
MAPSLLISTHFTSKSYGAHPLFTDISLQVFDNERLGLIGPNGAGKSTFLKILADMEPSLEVLEESLEEFPGAIALITHDRFLMERLCDRLLYLDGDGGAEYFADYVQWLQHRKDRLSATSRFGETSQIPPKKKPKKPAYEARKELNRIEKQIEKAEGIADNLQQQLHDSEIMCDAHRLAERYAQHQEAQKKVDQLYERWEELEALSRG